MDSIFIFLDRIHRIDGIFFTCGEMYRAEGRFIPTILLTCPLVPLCIAYFFAVRSHIGLLVWLAGYSCMAGGSCPFIFQR